MLTFVCRVFLFPDGPAEKAMVPLGAHVIQVNGQLVHDDMDHLMAVLQQAGDSATFMFEG